MFSRGLRGQSRYRACFQWRRRGRDPNERRNAFFLGDFRYFQGSESGSNYDRFVFSVQQSARVVADVNAAVRDPRPLFHDSQGSQCSSTGARCANDCAKV